MAPCVIFEDEHLLVVNKPAGWNTHAPAPYAGEGIYDWLRHREKRWSKLAIIHRLDKETSGVLLFSKTPLANRELTAQFTAGRARKKYVFLTEGRREEAKFTVRSCLVRAGEKYLSRPLHAGGAVAETRFRLANGAKAEVAEGSGMGNAQVWEAEPMTGRTHQIRVHAAAKGLPILGDTLYGGGASARVYLHATELTVTHPATGEEMKFRVEVDFESDPRTALRTGVIDAQESDCYRLIHGASDQSPGWYVDRLGEYILTNAGSPPTADQRDELDCMRARELVRGVYHKVLLRDAGKSPRQEAEAKLILGETAPERFIVRENGVRFELSLNEGYSVGLFLDQRDNRRRALTGHVGAGFELYAHSTGRPEVLNTFAYSCGFSVCAAKGGARVTSLDLSKKYLEWGKRNFELNQIDPAEHDFIYGNVFDWLPRLGKKGRLFDLVLIDPPTFSQSKEFGVFRAEKDYGKLVSAALPLVKPGSALFCSSNAADWPVEDFLMEIEAPIRVSSRRILQWQYFPQPPDFPISRGERAYLKTIWLRIG